MSVATATTNVIVRPARRMLSAISFGVLRRSAPSTSAIIRSRKDWPGSWVTWITSRSESSFVPPVTADRSPPASRITGADSPVIADSSTEPDALDHLAVGRDDLARLDDHHVPPLELGRGNLAAVLKARERRRARRPQRVRLRLAAALGDRLGEVREQHRQPEPDRDHRDEPEIARVAPEELQEEDDRRDRAAELDDEHHRVPDLAPRVELRERPLDRGEDDLLGEDTCGGAGHYELCSLSSARFSFRTLTPGSPKKPSEPIVGRSASISFWTVSSGRCRTAATRLDWSCA